MLKYVAYVYVHFACISCIDIVYCQHVGLKGGSRCRVVLLCVTVSFIVDFDCSSCDVMYIMYYIHHTCTSHTCTSVHKAATYNSFPLLTLTPHFAPRPFFYICCVALTAWVHLLKTLIGRHKPSLCNNNPFKYLYSLSITSDSVCMYIHTYTMCVVLLIFASCTYMYVIQEVS